jgi:hypothetical protein
MTDNRSTLSSFTDVQRHLGDICDVGQSAFQLGHGSRARLLRGVLREVDQALEHASQGYLAANQRFAQASRNSEAVQAGRDSAMRGRTEDTIPAFRALTPQGQQAFLAGYADPLIDSATSERAQADSLPLYWILERHALSVVLAEPLPRSILIREYLEMILVADPLSGVDINPDGHASSLILKKHLFHVGEFQLARIVLSQRMQLLCRDLVGLDGALFGEEGAKVFHKAARDRGVT